MIFTYLGVMYTYSRLDTSVSSQFFLRCRLFFCNLYGFFHTIFLYIKNVRRGNIFFLIAISRRTGMKPKGSFLSVKTLTRKIDCWCLFTDINSHSRELASGQIGMLLGSFIETIKGMDWKRRQKALILLMLHLQGV